MDEKIDKLYEATKFYIEKLDRKAFLFVTKCSKEIKSFEIFFDEDSFKHLIGLHKLSEEWIYKTSSRRLIKRILDKELTYDYIKKDKKFRDMRERLDNFLRLSEILLSTNTIAKKSLKGYFGSGKGIDADYLFSIKNLNGQGYLHLFLKNEKNKFIQVGKSKQKQENFLTPVTFIKEDSDFYLKNVSSVPIIAIEEIPRNNPAEIIEYIIERTKEIINENLSKNNV